MSRETLHRSELTPGNLKSVFNFLAALYNRLIKNHRGIIRIAISEDAKGIDIRFRIPMINLSSSMRAVIRICIDRFIAKDRYLQLKDEDE